MAKKQLNMMEKMVDANLIDYYIINCAISSIITMENPYQIDFGNPVQHLYSANERIVALLFEEIHCKLLHT